MLKFGIAPFLECSTRGEKRLSAFNAYIHGKGNRNIESIYQAAKIFPDGSTNLTWREAKGKKAINQEQCNYFYSLLWDEYIAENPKLLILIKQASGLSDMFGQTGHCCQAEELWRIRNRS